jgi:hypothetical protein
VELNARDGARKVGVLLPAGAAAVPADGRAGRPAGSVGEFIRTDGVRQLEGWSDTFQPRRIGAPRHLSPTVDTFLAFILYV